MGDEELMSGLEKILQQIAEDGERGAAELINKATIQAQSIIDDAKANIALIEKDSAEKMAADARNIEASSHSQAELEKKKAILIAKQRIIGQTISAAHKKLCDMHRDEYFSLMIKMIRSSALPRKGEILFNKNDLSRLPEDFEKTMGEAISHIPGASIKIGAKAADIDGGFILTYEGIEENCSFESWFYSHTEELQDRMNQILFGV